MEALRLTATWPVPHVAAATIDAAGAVATIGPTDRTFRLASISKPLTAWAAMVAVEEGIVQLDAPLDDQGVQPGCTLRHLLSHAGGYAFDGPDPISKPGVRRIYSNTGIELVGQCIGRAAHMAFETYLHEAVFAPLGMTSTDLRGSPAHGVHSTVEDLVRFTTETRVPKLITEASATQVSTVQFPALAGIIPGIGRFDPSPWGLGFEVRGNKHPHWTGTRNSPATFGHFGGAGTLLWVDPGVNVVCIALTDRPFDEWASDALQLWPQLSDAVLLESAANERSR